jgi:hypothetical protein
VAVGHQWRRIRVCVCARSRHRARGRHIHSVLARRRVLRCRARIPSEAPCIISYLHCPARTCADGLMHERHEWVKSRSKPQKTQTGHSIPVPTARTAALRPPLRGRREIRTTNATRSRGACFPDLTSSSPRVARCRAARRVVAADLCCSVFFCFLIFQCFLCCQTEKPGHYARRTRTNAATCGTAG